jgi:hypothetical protein
MARPRGAPVLGVVGSRWSCCGGGRSPAFVTVRRTFGGRVRLGSYVRGRRRAEEQHTRRSEKKSSLGGGRERGRDGGDLGVLKERREGERDGGHIGKARSRSWEREACLCSIQSDQSVQPWQRGPSRTSVWAVLDVLGFLDFPTGTTPSHVFVEVPRARSPAAPFQPRRRRPITNAPSSKAPPTGRSLCKSCPASIGKRRVLRGRKRPQIVQNPPCQESAARRCIVLRLGAASFRLLRCMRKNTHWPCPANRAHRPV